MAALCFPKRVHALKRKYMQVLFNKESESITGIPDKANPPPRPLGLGPKPGAAAIPFSGGRRIAVFSVSNSVSEIAKGQIEPTIM